MTKQSVVGETADQDANGNTGSVAATNSRYGNCSGDKAFGANIDYMEAQSRLIKYRVDGSGEFICASNSALAFASSATGINTVAVGRCGYGNYRGDGWHSVDIDDHLWTGTSTTPQGYNS